MIQEINLGGELRPISFSLNALALFGKLTKRPLKDVLALSPETTQLEDFIVLMWCGFKDGARIHKKEFAYTVEDIGDWISDSPEAFADLLVMFNEAQPPEETNKKKETESPPLSP